MFRLAHLSLKTINDEPVTLVDQQEAGQLFGVLGEMAGQMPRARMAALGNTHLPIQMPSGSESTASPRRRSSVGGGGNTAAVSSSGSSSSLAAVGGRQGSMARLRAGSSGALAAPVAAPAAAELASMSDDDMRRTAKSLVAAAWKEAAAVSRAMHTLNRNWDGVVESVALDMLASLQSKQRA